MKRLYGVIGCPIQHSMSPLIHNDAFQQKNIDAHYQAFHVTPHDLEEGVRGLRALGVSGFNVTIPHKEAILPMLDKVDETALRIGAVNTVVNEDGILVGYNTDGTGYVHALKEITSLDHKRILLIGAGGAARAILYSLAQENGVNLDVYNRTRPRALGLIDEFSIQDKCRAVTKEEAMNGIPHYDIIIQTTSAGMHPLTEDTPLPLFSLKEQAVVSDIIYNPLESKMLQEAKSKGALTQNGVGMFVFQAALAFQHWTNEFPDIKRMETIVTERLGGT